MKCFVAPDSYGDALGHRQGVVRIEPVIQHPLHQSHLGAFRYIDGIPTAFLHIGIGPDRQPGAKKQGTNGDQSAEVPEQLIHFATPLGIIPLFSSIALKNKEQKGFFRKKALVFLCLAEKRRFSLPGKSAIITAKR